MIVSFLMIAASSGDTSALGLAALVSAVFGAIIGIVGWVQSRSNARAANNLDTSKATREEMTLINESLHRLVSILQAQVDSLADDLHECEEDKTRLQRRVGELELEVGQLKRQ